MRGEGAPRGSSQSELSSGGGRAREFRTAATHTAGRRHADDRLEVAHVAAEALARDAPTEDLRESDWDARQESKRRAERR